MTLKCRENVNELENAVDSLNQVMAEATAIESSNVYLLASDEQKNNFAQEIYRCQNLLDRFEILQINQRCKAVVFESNDEEIYLEELKENCKKLNNLIVDLE